MMVSQAWKAKAYTLYLTSLILVAMDDGLWNGQGYSSAIIYLVLILVVMDDGLTGINHERDQNQQQS
jgi:hypothetical protein